MQLIWFLLVYQIHSRLKIKSRFGNFNTGQVYAAAGQSNGRLGYLLEYHSNKSDGFKN